MLDHIRTCQEREKTDFEVLVTELRNGSHSLASQRVWIM